MKRVIDGSKKWHGLGKMLWQYLYRTGFSKKATEGDWRLDFLKDDKLQKTVYVTASSKYTANRAPKTPPSMKIIPENTEKSGFLRCVVAYSVTALDPDLDKIRYHYRWYMNGILKREIISAVREDVFPIADLEKGDKVRCELKASDGRLESDALAEEYKI